MKLIEILVSSRGLSQVMHGLEITRRAVNAKESAILRALNSQLRSFDAFKLLVEVFDILMFPRERAVPPLIFVAEEVISLPGHIYIR